MDKLKTSNHIVAFIDILGATEMIKEDSNKSLNKVHEIYETAIKNLKKIEEKLKDDNCENPMKVKIFSDNIVIYCECENFSENIALKITTVFAKYMQFLFLMEGITVRGGITKGDFYADDVMLWGNALSKSYYIESNIAIYPRIVIDPILMSETYFPQYLKEQYLKKDFDGLYYIDYLNYLEEVSDNDIEKEKMIKDFLENIPQNNKGDIKLEQKYNWHQKYIKDFMYKNWKIKENNPS